MSEQDKLLCNCFLLDRFVHYAWCIEVHEWSTVVIQDYNFSLLSTLSGQIGFVERRTIINSSAITAVLRFYDASRMFVDVPLKRPGRQKNND